MWQEINYKDSNDLLVPNITYKINPAEIESIEANSIAQEIGFESGDSIISINGKKPRDLIDYQILISEEILDISVLDKNHEIHNINILDYFFSLPMTMFISFSLNCCFKEIIFYGLE